MTQSTQNPPGAPTPDELVTRYLAAHAALGADADSTTQPSPAVHANVLAYAQQLIDSRTEGARTEGAHNQDKPTTDATPPVDMNAINSIATPAVNTWTIGTFDKKNQASNDHQWKIRALASVAVFGLSSLLFFQWQSASPDEQDAAFSMQRPHAQAPAKSPTTATATAPAPSSEASPAVPPAATADSSAAPAPAQPAPAAAAAPAAAPSPAQSSTQDKESAKASALGVPPSADRVEKSSSAKARRESAAEIAAAPQVEISQTAPAAAPAPAVPAVPAAPNPAAPTQPANAAPALARGKMALPDTKAAQSNENNTQFDQPAAARVTPLVAAATANTALFNAIRSKNRSALQTALGNGADKNAQDNGTPAVTLCVQAGQTELVRVLLAAGADVNALDAQGISALDHARGRDLQDIMALLVQYGAK